MKRLALLFSFFPIFSLLASCAPPTSPLTPTSLPPTATSLPPTATPLPTPSAESSPTPPGHVPALSGTGDPLAPQPVAFPASDGLALAGIFYPAPAPDSPAVLLLHMYGGVKEHWMGLQIDLQKEGFASLAVDLRGHGQTGGADDWEKAKGDSLVALRFLRAQPNVAPARIGVIGASVGANLALHAGADDPDVNAVVSLSPGLDYFGLRLEGVMARYGDRPALLVASEDDPYSAEAVRQLAGEAQGEVTMQIYKAAGHGLYMFYTEEPDLTTLLFWFLDMYLS